LQKCSAANPVLRLTLFGFVVFYLRARYQRNEGPVTQVCKAAASAAVHPLAGIFAISDASAMVKSASEPVAAPIVPLYSP